MKVRFAVVQVIVFIMVVAVSLSFIFINSQVLVSKGDLTDGGRSSKYNDVPCACTKCTNYSGASSICPQNLTLQQDHINTLLSQLSQLQKELDFERAQKRNLSRQLVNVLKFTNVSSMKQSKCFPGFDEKQGALPTNAGMLFGVELNNEYEVVPFTRFTSERLYLVDPGLGKRVIEKPIGYKRKDLNLVIGTALKKLNFENKNKILFRYSSFIEGIFREVPGIGTVYELYFRTPENNKTSIAKVTVTRVLSQLSLLVKKNIPKRQKIINIIIPLSGRVDFFKRFIDNFVNVCVVQDKKVNLTVVYFGNDGLEEIKSIIRNVTTVYKFRGIRVITLNEEFSRGRGLTVGAQSIPVNDTGDTLLFLCDVDVVFNGDFLERCRLNAELGKRVYYPIVFSLYNPKIVYEMQVI